MEPSPRSSFLGVVVLVLVIGIGLVIGVAGFGGGDTPIPPSADATSTTAVGGDTSTTPGGVAGETTTSTLPVIDPTDTTEPGPGVGEVGGPWGSVSGLLMFRGNPTRTWYGTGPMPTTTPDRVWRYPSSGMCSQSTNLGSTTTLCGTGWTGQPAVRVTGKGTEVIFGAYDHKVHFLDAATGTPVRAPFATGDIIKGSVTVDPDGYPIVYSGSRDDFFHVIAIDRDPDAITHGKATLTGYGPRLSLRQGNFADLRAIPWVFSWSQARLFLPAWYGMGTAVEAFEDRLEARGAAGEILLPAPR